MDFLLDYGLFLAKIVTAVIALLLLSGGLIAIASKGKQDKGKGRLVVTILNEHFQKLANKLQAKVLPTKEYKRLLKRQDKEKAAAKKQHKSKAVYVLDFKGDIHASAVNGLRECITAIISVAEPNDEVILRLESPGGSIIGYGLAASQLQRLRQERIPLTVCVDKVAASGGYLMACVANHIYAAPFAVIGSIGVVLQLPNFNRLLKKHDIEFEQVTAGEYKRTLTVFGENTRAGREKVQTELETAHDLFKRFIEQYRSHLNVAEVATGEHWFGTEAFDKKLVDGIQTSDDHLLQLADKANVFQVQFKQKKSLAEKLGKGVRTVYSQFMDELSSGNNRIQH